LIAVSVAALLWGTTGVAVRIIHERSGLTAVPIGCLRLAVAALAVFVVLGPRGVRAGIAVVRRDPWLTIGAGIGLGSYQALYFVGVQDVGVSISTLVSLGVAPVALTVVAAVRGRRAPGVLQTVTVVAAVGGLVLISVKPGSSSASHPTIGLIASFLAGAGYAATTLLNRRMARDGDPLLLTGLTSAIGAVVLIPLAVADGLWWPSDLVASGWLVYIGVVTTVAAYALFFTGLKTVASETAGVLTLIEPLTAAILAAIVVHESLSGLGVVGAALMLAAIAGLYLRAPEADVHDRRVTGRPPI
jgi:DME family drug/metabolite transporter